MAPVSDLDLKRDPLKSKTTEEWCGEGKPLATLILLVLVWR